MSARVKARRTRKNATTDASTAAVGAESWSRREHVSIATGEAPREGGVRKPWTVVIRHGTEVPLVKEECRVEISGPGMERGTETELSFWCWGNDLSALSEVFAAAVAQAARDSATTPKAPAYR